MGFIEFRKIWNGRTLLLVSLVSGALLYSWVMGQMNLSHLPLFETVEVEIGTQLLEKYGSELDEKELAEIRLLYEQADERLNETALSSYPEITQMGLESFRELEHDCTYFDDGIDMADIEKFYESEEYKLYETVIEDSNIEWELETCNSYNSYHFRMEKAKETGKDTFSISTLPESVQMNMGYIIQDYSRIVLIVTLLLVLPYAAMENRNRVYPLAAATKTGRKLVVYQIRAVLAAVLLLAIVLNIIFYVIYRLKTPYERFAPCLILDSWFPFTWSGYLIVRMLMLDVWAMAHAMLIFFLTSFCKTIVGTVVMALPCWGLGEVAGLWFFPHVFARPDGEYANIIDFIAEFSNVFSVNKYVPIVVEAAVLAGSSLLLWWLYRKRKREDIVE